MSDPAPGSLEETPNPGSGDPGNGAPAPAGAAPSGGEPGGQPPAPPAEPGLEGIPANIQAAFDKRFAAMEAKHQAELEAIRSGAQPGGPGGGEGGGAEEAPFASYDAWKAQALGNDPKATALFDGFQKALTADIDRAVVAYVEEKLGPLNKGFQGSEEKAFYAANPGAQAKRQEIEAEIKAIPGLTREKAWRIINYGAPPPARPPKLPPPGQKPGGAGAPSDPANLPRGKGINAIVEAVAESRGT